MVDFGSSTLRLTHPQHKLLELWPYAIWKCAFKLLIHPDQILKLLCCRTAAFGVNVMLQNDQYTGKELSAASWTFCATHCHPAGELSWRDLIFAWILPWYFSHLICGEGIGENSESLPRSSTAEAALPAVTLNCKFESSGTKSLSRLTGATSLVKGSHIQSCIGIANTPKQILIILKLDGPVIAWCS